MPPETIIAPEMMPEMMPETMPEMQNYENRRYIHNQNMREWARILICFTLLGHGLGHHFEQRSYASFRVRDFNFGTDQGCRKRQHTTYTKDLAIDASVPNIQTQCAPLLQASEINKNGRKYEKYTSKYSLDIFGAITFRNTGVGRPENSTLGPVQPKAGFLGSGTPVSRHLLLNPLLQNSTLGPVQARAGFLGSRTSVSRQAIHYSSYYYRLQLCLVLLLQASTLIRFITTGFNSDSFCYYRLQLWFVLLL